MKTDPLLESKVLAYYSARFVFKYNGLSVTSRATCIGIWLEYNSPLHTPAQFARRERPKNEIQSEGKS